MKLSRKGITPSSTGVNQLIYKLYFFCIPFGHIFNFPFNDAIHAYVPEYAVIFMLLGLAVLVSTSGIKFSKRLSKLWKLYGICVLLSVVLSVALALNSDDLIESPFHAILGDIVLYLIFVLSVCYNSYSLTHTVRFKDLIPILNLQLIILLIVGYLQFLAMRGMSLAENMYLTLCRVFALRDFTWISDLERGVTFFGTEVASASLLCYLIIPFNLVRIASTKGRTRFWYILSLALFSVLFLTSGSSSALISFLIVVGCFALLRLHFPVKVLMGGAFVAGMTIAILYSVSFGFGSRRDMDDDRSSFNYILAGKLFDTNNRSTLTRASTVINDMRIFYNQPLIGCGNGNQGFYYNENVPAWMDESDEVGIIRKTIPNGGGNFFPSYLSGFGILGIIFLILFLTRYFKWMGNSILVYDENLKELFYLGMILFLVSSWYVIPLKQSEAIAFLFSLPFIAMSKPKP